MDRSASRSIVVLADPAEDAGLGACAIGRRDPRQFASLTGADGLTEIWLAEMAVGRPI